MNEFTCIYCLKQKPLAQFNREHVVPEAFGHFKDNLVLDHEVCADCNSYFGQTLDYVLARGSLQGILRYLRGVKPLIGVRKAIQSRVKIHMVSNDPPDEVEFVQTDEGDGVRITPGLKYWNRGNSQRQFISLYELESAESGLLDDLDRNQLVVLMYANQEEKERIRNALRRMGLGIDIDTEVFQEIKPGEQIPIAFDVIEDETTRRGIAKIAVNYLAKIHGATFVLNQGFNGIRKYIRCGKQSDKTFIHKVKNLPLYQGREEARRRGGHQLQIDLAPTGTEVIGGITLFQLLSYHISFGSYQGAVLLPKLASVHYFDVLNKEVIKSQAITKPPTIWLPPRGS